MNPAILQTTIRTPVGFSHRGLRSGRTSGVRLRPGLPDTGIVFNGRIPATAVHAFVEGHAVGLRSADESVFGVEHLLAACYGLGVDNLRVDVSGDEVPFGDGSALPFVRIIRAAGLRAMDRRRRVQTVNRPVAAWAGDSCVVAFPTDDGGLPNISCVIDFPDKEVGLQSFRASPEAESFAAEVGPARTFGRWDDDRPLPAWLGRSAHTVDGMALPNRPRYPNEQARHKTLDLMGDLCLLGRRLHARVFAYKSGHRLHHEFLRKLEEEWT